jgi:perosamine synthetase
VNATDDNDYLRWPRVSAAAEQRVVELLRAGHISAHAETQELFEADLARLCGVCHALCCTNGTAASYLAMRALGVGPGDTVVAAALGHWASVLPATQCGARVVLADVAAGTCLLDPAAVEPLVDGSTRAVVVTHLHGAPAPVAELRALCDRLGLALVEDISHAHGATCQGRPVGSFGDLAFTSFQAAKLIAGGEGGALLTDRDELFYRAMEIGHPRYLLQAPPEWRRFAGTGWGFKFQPSALLVALAHESLKELDVQNAVRRQACEHFRHILLDAGAFVEQALPDPGRVYYRCELSLPVGTPPRTRDALLGALRAGGVRVDGLHSYLPDLPALAGSLPEGSAWPAATDAAARTLLFDPFTAYDPDFVERYAARVLEIVDDVSRRPP